MRCPSASCWSARTSLLLSEQNKAQDWVIWWTSQKSKKLKGFLNCTEHTGKKEAVETESRSKHQCKARAIRILQQSDVCSRSSVVPMSRSQQTLEHYLVPTLKNGRHCSREKKQLDPRWNSTRSLKMPLMVSRGVKTEIHGWLLLPTPLWHVIGTETIA